MHGDRVKTVFLLTAKMSDVTSETALVKPTTVQCAMRPLGERRQAGRSNRRVDCRSEAGWLPGWQAHEDCVTLAWTRERPPTNEKTWAGGGRNSSCIAFTFKWILYRKRLFYTAYCVCVLCRQCVARERLSTLHLVTFSFVLALINKTQPKTKKKLTLLDNRVWGGCAL